MTNREISHEGAAQLPKLLFDLVTQADQCDSVASTSDAEDASAPSTSSKPPMSSAQDIVNNLPKVWKVLIELLNHQEVKPVEIAEDGSSEDCYNSVQTPTGPQLVLSVSKTYIKLKDLILEKKFLQKETKKLKNLNTHLGTRLEQQERRLGTVSVELNKTWNLVGRMQRQRRQLHTQEQVLRYHLQQKRRLLGELKEELEYCRRKWDLAKAKNKESQTQWDALRLEFSKRKELDACNSAESGYSDGPASEEDDDDEEKASQPTESNRKGIKEKFLLKVEKGGRKAHRIHSVSPIRCAKIIHEIVRRNSESHVPQFATEIFQAMPVEVQPVELVTVTSESHACVENVPGCSGVSQISPNVSSTAEAVRVNSKHRRDVCEARKLAELKVGVKTNFEMRKQSQTAGSASPSKRGESLEEMFLRLSGEPSAQDPVDQGRPEGAEALKQVGSITESEQASDDAVDAESVPNVDERLQQRSERIEQLEDECKSLLTQVSNTSAKGDELNRQADEICERFSVIRPSESAPSTSAAEDEPKPSTSVAEDDSAPSTSASAGDSLEAIVKTDEECLSHTEREYTSRRDQRLAQLEAESRAFLARMNQRVNRATTFDNQLEYLRGRYGDEAAENDEANETAQISTIATDDNAPPDESNENDPEQSDNIEP